MCTDQKIKKLSKDDKIEDDTDGLWYSIIIHLFSYIKMHLFSYIKM